MSAGLKEKALQQLLAERSERTALSRWFRILASAHHNLPSNGDLPQAESIPMLEEQTPQVVKHEHSVTLQGSLPVKIEPTTVKVEGLTMGEVKPVNPPAIPVNPPSVTVPATNSPATTKPVTSAPTTNPTTPTPQASSTLKQWLPWALAALGLGGTGIGIYQAIYRPTQPTAPAVQPSDHTQRESPLQWLEDQGEHLPGERTSGSGNR